MVGVLWIQSLQAFDVFLSKKRHVVRVLGFLRFRSLRTLGYVFRVWKVLMIFRGVRLVGSWICLWSWGSACQCLSVF